MPDARKPAKGAKSDAIKPIVRAAALTGLMLICTGHITSWSCSIVFVQGTQWIGSKMFALSFSFIHIILSN